MGRHSSNERRPTGLWNVGSQPLLPICCPAGANPSGPQFGLISLILSVTATESPDGGERWSHAPEWRRGG